MKLDIKASSLRWFLFCINIIYFLLGYSMIAAGFAVKQRKDLVNGPLVHLLSELNTQIDGATIADMLVTLSNLFIANGFASVAIALIGGSGAVARRSCLIAYGIDVTIVIILAVVTVVLAWFLGSGEALYLQDTMTANLQRAYLGSQVDEGVSVGWNFLFLSYGCCGAGSYLDFAEASSWNRTALVGPDLNVSIVTTTPLYCCKGLNNFTVFAPPPKDTYWNCAVNPTVKTSNYKTGCAAALRSTLKEYSFTLFILGGITILVMLLCAAASILLFIRMGRHSHEEIDPGGCTET